MLYRALALVMLAAASTSAAERLYLKDGDYHVVREYQILGDRVRYYSTERGDWEEIPLELVDLERTRKEASDIKADFERDRTERAEEDAAVRAARDQVAQVPAEPGVYAILEGKLHKLAVAESKVVSNKRRTVLKMISPIPLLTGKATLELDGETAAWKAPGPRPEFFFRLSDYEAFGIVKLMPKKDARIVENMNILKLQGEQLVEEIREMMPTFKKNEGELLYRIWPEKPLEPGEYALIQFTDGKMNPQVWDFSVAKP